MRRFGVVTPLVDAGAKFRGPAKYDDVLRVEAFVETWETRRFRIVYKLSVADRPVAEGFEVRASQGRDVLLSAVLTESASYSISALSAFKDACSLPARTRA